MHITSLVVSSSNSVSVWFQKQMPTHTSNAEPTNYHASN